MEESSLAADLMINVAQVPKRKRRGDSGRDGVRTIRDGSVIFRGHRFHLSEERNDPTYVGQLEGKRGVFWYGDRERLVLRQMYDVEDYGLVVRIEQRTTVSGVPWIIRLPQWRKWVRLDYFEG